MCDEMRGSMVSIITPSFNAASFLDDYFSSLFRQTWKNFEILFIDDGSSDDSLRIAEGWIGAFADRGIQLRVFSQTNSGQAAAVGKHLRFARGSYIVNIDSDDTLGKDFLKDRALLLDASPEMSAVLTSITVVGEKNDDFVKSRASDSGDFFEDVLFSRNIPAYAGALIRRESFVANNRAFYFFEGKTGQNMQILLPAAANNRIRFIANADYFYFMRSDSHSHSKRYYKKRPFFERERFETSMKTLSVLRVGKKAYYEKKLQETFGSSALRQHLIHLDYNNFVDDFRFFDAGSWGKNAFQRCASSKLFFFCYSLCVALPKYFAKLCFRGNKK